VDWKFILEMIDSEIPLARKRYRALLEEAKQYRGGDILEEKRAIGKFSAWIKKRYPDFLRRGKKGKFKRLLPDGYAGDIELESVIQHLKSKKWLRQPGDKKARRFAAAQLRARGYTMEEIADHMDISRSTVSRALSDKSSSAQTAKRKSS